MSKKVPAKQLKDETYYKVRLIRHSCCLSTYTSQVKWTRVPDLIEHRKVFVKGGWAYVPASEQSSLVFHEFESRLERDLQVRILAATSLTLTLRLPPRPP